MPTPPRRAPFGPWLAWPQARRAGGGARARPLRVSGMGKADVGGPYGANTKILLDEKQLPKAWFNIV